MRIIHTSDLHLGQNFFGRTRQHEHDRFLCWLVDQVRSHDVDAVVIAGDLYDTAMPPSYAREQCNRFIDAMIDTGALLILLGGNHDSPATLGENRRLLARLSTLVIPEVTCEPADQVFVVNRRDGQPGMVLCGVPFIRARDVARSAPGQGDEEKRLAVMNGIAQYYADIYAAALIKREALGLNVPIVATGHLTTVGANSSESVREIYVGSLNAFPVSLFPPAEYIALGHIHRPQVVGSYEHIRYCGSPITLSFDELGQDKQILLVEFEDGQRRRIEPIPVPTFQPLVRIRAAIDDLPEELTKAAAPFTAELPAWAEITVEAGDYLPDLPARINEMLAGLPLEILRLRKARAQPAPTAIEPQPQTLDELSLADVFEQVLTARSSIPEDRLPRVRELFAEVAAEIQAGEAA